VLYATDDAWHIADAGDKIEPGKGKLATDEIEVKIDPRVEWAQMFDEAWRINRDWFYDPGMHGADWPAMKAKYAVFLPDLAERQDLNDVLQWMCSELAVGHHRVFGGDTLWETEDIDGGLLGADYEIADGRYRFAKVYGGLNWNPDLRSPLTEPGVGVKPGEYLLAVEGEDLRPPANLYARFENTAGKIVEITVGPDPDGSGSRTVHVVPVADESDLRNRDWVEGNLRKVTAATGGRVAYVYVPNTTRLGHLYFKRYFFPQADRDAIIVDERHNGGGQVADYYIDLLRRPSISHWAMRYGEDLKTPIASIQGPKVMLIDETAGSGGDLLPWMFRKLELGTLVGRPTWGGLVGILGFPALMDGGQITAPNLAIWTEDGWVVENVGVPPDVEVEQTPAEVIAGHDPQLEKAIEIALEQLEAHPPHQVHRPPYPVRVRH
jgi:tricorn protease